MKNTARQTYREGAVTVFTSSEGKAVSHRLLGVSMRKKLHREGGFRGKTDALNVIIKQKNEILGPRGGRERRRKNFVRSM